jgi:hypothetical protein
MWVVITAEANWKDAGGTGTGSYTIEQAVDRVTAEIGILPGWTRSFDASLVGDADADYKWCHLLIWQIVC